MHAGDAGEAPVVPDPDVPARREHPRREPRLRIGSAVELVELQEIALAEQIDGSSARLEEVGAGERELEVRLRRLDRVPVAEDIEERRRGVHVEGGRQRRQQLAEQRHHRVARLLGDRDQDRHGGLR